MTATETELSFSTDQIIFIFVTILSAIAAVVTIFFAIKKFSLKIDNEFESSYIDANSNEYVEYRKFKIKLGYAIRAVKLPKKFDRNSDVKLWYKPSNAFKKEMTRDNYDFDLGKKHKKVKLIDKNFIKSKEIELIHSKMVKTISDDERREYVEKVHVNAELNPIRIENFNDEEIHNYSFDMPASVKYEDAPFYFSDENVLEIKAVLYEDGLPNQHISEPRLKIVLKKIPPRDQNNNPGIITIPLPSTPS